MVNYNVYRKIQKYNISIFFIFMLMINLITIVYILSLNINYGCLETICKVEKYSNKNCSITDVLTNNVYYESNCDIYKNKYNICYVNDDNNLTPVCYNKYIFRLILVLFSIKIFLIFILLYIVIKYHKYLHYQFIYI